jgi:arylsulfatase A-like enzyme
LDSDEFGHLNRYREYTDSLLRYDRWIAELREALDEMGEYGRNTSIVVTTDHGRGRSFFWAAHGPNYSNSFRTWAAVIPSDRNRVELKVHRRNSREYSQLDIRPTLEQLLGIAPSRRSADTVRPLFDVATQSCGSN